MGGYNSRRTVFAWPARAASRVLTERLASFAALTGRLFLAAVRFALDRRGAVRDLAGVPFLFFIGLSSFGYGCPRNQGSERSAAEQMHVQVIDLLTAVCVA